MAPTPTGYERLAAELHHNAEGLVRRCCERYAASSVRLTNSVDASSISRLLSPIIQGLSEAMRVAEGVPLALVPGTANLRELEKSVGFTGAVMASSGASGFDVGALMLSVRDVLGELVDPPAHEDFRALLEWLTILAVESFSTAGTAAAGERLREQLERGMPTMFVAAGIPATMLVASPGRLVLGHVFGRVVLMVVRVGAKNVIVDATGLADPLDPAVLEAVEQFCAHPKIGAVVELAVTGLSGDAETIWRQRITAGGGRSELFASFDEAVAHCLDRAGYRLVRNSVS